MLFLDPYTPTKQTSLPPRSTPAGHRLGWGVSQNSRGCQGTQKPIQISWCNIFKINANNAWWKTPNFKERQGQHYWFFLFLQTPKCLCCALLTDLAVTSPLATFINDVSQKLVLITPFHTSNFYSSMPQHLSVALFCFENPFPLVTGRTLIAIWIILDPFQCLLNHSRHSAPLCF